MKKQLTEEILQILNGRTGIWSAYFVQATPCSFQVVGGTMFLQYLVVLASIFGSDKLFIDVVFRYGST